MFPWAGFVFAGAALGVVLDGRDGSRRAIASMRPLRPPGWLLTWLGFYTASRPAIYRAVVVLDQLADVFRDSRRRDDGGVCRALRAWSSWRTGSAWRVAALERFGRRSLFVYWIHVELVYGYATWPLRGTAAAVGCRASRTRRLRR